ncbi:beta-L-arabinofuranosidase domain-containing protein [Dictyobacter halimunensis]
MLPTGAIRPAGWLYEQLQLQAQGLTGHLDEIWPDVGPNSEWLGGTGEGWERGPYYCDGLIPLAYLLQDERLIKKAQQWVEHALNSQGEDGQFGPRSNQDWWPRMVMLKALIQYYEATQDPRIPDFMTRYFRYQLAHLTQQPLRDWAIQRGYDNVLCVYWLYAQTHEPFLLELVALLEKQTLSWADYFENFAYKERQPTGDNNRLTHVVNVAMGLKAFAFHAMRDRNNRHQHLQAAKEAIATLMRYHGQVQGAFSGDEHLAGTDPTQGVELCAIVEFMFSLEQLICMFGAGQFADQLESLAYNALPTTITADMRAHQYDQQPNQVTCTIAKRNWTLNGDDSNIFGLAPHFGCCTANMHQGWPKLVQSLWMGTDGDGLAAIAYAPCTLQTRLANGTEVTLEETTSYPFEETVRFSLQLSQSATFPMRLRIPGWCKNASVTINGQQIGIVGQEAEQGFISLQRTWQSGDRVELHLPMEVREIPRPRDAIGVALGPLVFALRIGEEWTRLPDTPGFGDWEVRPMTTWNYGLSTPTDQSPADLYRVERGPLTMPPFGHEQTAVRIRTSGYKLPEWSLVQNSAGPVPSDARLPADSTPEAIMLIPYGCARLRIAEFPHVKSTAQA